MYQLIVVTPRASSIWFGGVKNPGDVVWVRSLDAARHLLEHGICKWPAPKETKPAGPTEIKPAGPAEKKFSADLTAGPSTGLRSSNAPGPEVLSSASAAALVPPQRQ
jgi:hypothetical protein